MAARFPMAVVVVGSPLTVTIEGASAVVAAEDFVGGLTTGDRVQAAFLGDRLVVLARAGGNSPNPNLIIDSNFAVNQRGYVSGTDLALNAYGLDRWKATTANSRMTFTAAPQGQAVTIAAGDSFGQVVERANVVAGPHTLSWPGTSQARIYNVGASAPSYAASPITVALDGTTDVLAQFGPGTVGNVKLEQGSVATPYQPPTYADNLRACMRYYQRFGGASPYQRFGLGFNISTTQARIHIPYVTQMRVTPTGTWGELRLDDASSTAMATNLIVQVASTTVGYLTVTVASGLASGMPVDLRADGSSAGFVAFDSEL